MAKEDRLIDKTKVSLNSKSKLFLRYLPNVLINLIAVLAIALMTIVTFGFSWEYLLTPPFYITTLILVIIYTLTHWSLFDGHLKGLRSNKDNKAIMKEKSEEIAQTTDLIEWKNNRMKFISERNELEMIKAWKILVQNRLTKLQHKASAKDLKIERAQITDLQREIFKDNQEELKALADKYELDRSQNSYCIKKGILENQLTDLWILQNKNKLHIDFNEVDVQFIETGSVLRGIVKDKTQSKGKYAKDTTPSRVIGVLITVFISAFGTDVIVNGGDVSAWIVFAFRLLPFIMNIVMGINYAENFFEDIDLHNIDARLSITKEFKAWGLSKGIFEVKKENTEEKGE
jgi:hypothetical protein